MVAKGHTGEHLAAAKEMIEGLEPVTGNAGGDAQVRATAAAAHAVLALVEQVGMLRHALADASAGGTVRARTRADG